MNILKSQSFRKPKTKLINKSVLNLSSLVPLTTQLRLQRHQQEMDDRNIKRNKNKKQQPNANDKVVNKYSIYQDKFVYNRIQAPSQAHWGFSYPPAKQVEEAAKRGFCPKRGEARGAAKAAASLLRPNRAPHSGGRPASAGVASPFWGKNPEGMRTADRRAGKRAYIREEFLSVANKKAIQGNAEATEKFINPIIPPKSLVVLLRNKRQKNRVPYSKSFIDYKYTNLLLRFIGNGCKILPRRLTKLTSKQQRYIAKAIKTARIMGLLPFISKHKKAYRFIS